MIIINYQEVNSFLFSSFLSDSKLLSQIINLLSSNLINCPLFNAIELVLFFLLQVSRPKANYLSLQIFKLRVETCSQYIPIHSLL